MIGGWVAYLEHYADLGLMLAATSLPFVATGALLVVRCWSAQVCQVVRLTAQQEERCGDTFPTTWLP